MSELAAAGTHSSAAFAACWDAPQKRSGIASARHAALVVSIGLHVAVLILGAAAWQRQQRLEEPPSPRVRVTMFSRPQRSAAPPAAAAPAPPAAAAAPRALPPPRPVPVEQEPKPPAKPEPVSAATESAPPDAGAAAAAEDPQAEGAGSEGQGSLGGSASATAGSEAASGEAGSSPPPPALSTEQRKLVLEGYLQEIFRSRIAAQFQYPEEAERLGLEGLVVVRAAVLASGALRSARVIGDCPQRLLCAAAERTVRAAAPFPPPPAELGGAISVDVPLQYRLE